MTGMFTPGSHFKTVLSGLAVLGLGTYAAVSRGAMPWVVRNTEKAGRALATPAKQAIDIPDVEETKGILGSQSEAISLRIGGLVKKEANYQAMKDKDPKELERLMGREKGVKEAIALYNATVKALSQNKAVDPDELPPILSFTMLKNEAIERHNQSLPADSPLRVLKISSPDFSSPRLSKPK